MKHPLREFLEAGELSESRVSGASEALLVTLRQTGAVTRERAGRGWKLVLHNPEALRAVLAAQAPGILEAANPVLGPKAQAVSRSRDAHTAGAGEADLVLLKAKPGVVIQGPEGQQIDVGEMTRLAGAFSFVLKNENDWTLLGAPSATVATVENSECFLRSDSLGVEVDVWIYTHGRLSRRLLAWLAELAKGGGTLVHLGDYDPVGLDEYRRLRDGWGSRVRLHLPDRLEDLFRTRSSRSILQRPKNQELLGRLQAIEASLPADAKEVLRLIRLYGAGLEQEVLVGPNAVHRLSKSRFIAANQCQLRLWNQSYRPELATPPDPDTQARMDAGREVGELARSRFPGVLVEADHRHPEEALRDAAWILAAPLDRWPLLYQLCAWPANFPRWLRHPWEGLTEDGVEMRNPRRGATHSRPAETRDAQKVRAFFDLVEVLGIHPVRVQGMLGNISSSRYQRWRNQPATRFPLESYRRMEAFLRLWDCLLAFFNEQSIAQEWVIKPNRNPIFAGLAPIDALSGPGTLNKIEASISMFGGATQAQTE